MRDVRERIAVAAAPAEVVSTLRAVLGERGFTEYAVVDHGHDMAAAGQPGLVAWTVIFGNPAGGAKLLAHDLAAAVDIPLRLAVVGADGGSSAIVLRDMRSLLTDDVAELADAFTASLRTLSETTRDRVEADSRPAST
jgi:uncharacterized protein (DUF302 family)